MPRSLRIDPASPDPNTIAAAAETLTAGGIVVFPTETVYGIGALPTRPEAIERVNLFKRRPPRQPLLVHCADVAQAWTLAAVVPEGARLLADGFWPGPLALVLRAATSVPDVVAGGTGTIGIRVPGLPAFSALARVAGPIAGTSANLHGSPPPVTVGEVPPELLAAADLALDAGPLPGTPSTLLDLTASPPRLLRPGAISRDRIERALSARLTQ